MSHNLEAKICVLGAQGTQEIKPIHAIYMTNSDKASERLHWYIAILKALSAHLPSLRL